MYASKVDPPATRRAIDGDAGLAGLDAAVRRVLPPALYHYLAGASEDEATHARNLRAFSACAFLPKVLIDVSRRSLVTSLFGVDRALPFGIAPMGFSRLIAPDGDIALARAAAEAGIPFILSGASLTRMEEVRAAGATSWFQAYVPGEADRIAALVDRVEAAGFDTLVITADTAVHPKHERAARHGFRSPVRPSLGLAWQGLSRPGWLRRVVLRDRLAALKFRFENMDASQGPPVFSSSLIRDIGRRDALSWRDVEAVRKRWKGRLVIKGIMAAEDAAIAAQAGIDGIIVSNHGGRQIDCAASSLTALERIAARGLSLALMYDGGIRRGADVLKALKLGADFVFVGRPMLMAAAIGGQRGVTDAIALLAQETDIAMALLGIDRLAGLAEVELLRDRGSLGMSLDYSWLSDGLYQTWLLRGLGTTVLMSLLGIALMLAIGVVGALCLHFRLPMLETLTTVLVELFRNTPPLVQLFFLYFMLSEVGLKLTDPATGRSVPLFSGFTCVVLSLGLYNGAIAVEIIRSGLLAVPSQTVEGARSLGYTRFQAFRHVELPIGFRLSLPAMTNNVVSLIKTSSQAALVAVPDIMYGATQISLETFRNLEVMLLIWILYVALASLAVVVMRRLGDAFRIPGYGVQAS